MVWPHLVPHVTRHPLSSDENTPPVIEIVEPTRQDNPSLLLTASSLHLYDHTNQAVVSSHVRSSPSLEKYGFNVSVKHNKDDTVLAIQTDKGFLLVYAVLHPEIVKNSSDDEVLTVYTPSGNLLQNGLVQERQPGFFESATLEEPVLKHQLRFRLFLKITNGIVTYLPLSKWVILLATRSNVQLLNLGNDDHKILEVPDAEGIASFVPIGKDVLIIRIDGTVSRLAKVNTEDMYQVQHKLAVPEVLQVSVNKHFNLLALLTKVGELVHYNYVTNATVKTSQLDGVSKIQWSRDGNFLLVLFLNKSWSLMSTFGCTTFHSGEHDYDSSWLNSITQATILPHSRTLLMTDSKVIFTQPLLTQLDLNSQINYNTQHPILISGAEVHIYTGHEMPTTSTNGAINWNIIKIPFEQAHQLPHPRHASISPDGKYLALANRTSLLIYSFADREWSFYINDYNHDLHLSHLTWHEKHDLLIVTNKTSTHSELVVFDFRKFKAHETFDSDCIVFKYDVGSDVKLLNCHGADMVMYTSNNKYYNFVIDYGIKNGLRIDLVKILSMESIFKEGDNLRCMMKIKDKEDKDAHNLLVLNNGELLLLKQKGKTFEKLLLFERVEYVYKINDDELYLFNGKDLLLVKNFGELIGTKDPSKSVLSVHPENYPILLTMEKGLFVTVDNALTKRRTMELNVISSKNSIFLHDLIRFELIQHGAKEVYAHYKSYKNFQFALELLLYQTVVNEEDLTSIVKLLHTNPLYELNVVSKCLRKIEMTYWQKLLTELGTTPQELLNKSIELQEFKTLGILVVIFLNYQTENKDEGVRIEEDQLINILKLLYENANDDDELWETGFELLRFFKLLDGSGELLRKCEVTLIAN